MSNHKFDVAMGRFIFDSEIYKGYKIPGIRWSTYFGEPMLTTYSYIPFDTSINFPFLHPVPKLLYWYGNDCFTNRYINFVIAYYFDLWMNHSVFSLRSYATPHAKQARIDLNYDIHAGDGIHGIRDIK
jgi:hypothetical protein